jgi:hypothetical protein
MLALTPDKKLRKLGPQLGVVGAEKPATTSVSRHNLHVHRGIEASTRPNRRYRSRLAKVLNMMHPVFLRQRASQGHAGLPLHPPNPIPATRSRLVSSCVETFSVGTFQKEKCLLLPLPSRIQLSKRTSRQPCLLRHHHKLPRQRRRTRRRRKRYSDCPPPRRRRRRREWALSPRIQCSRWRRTMRTRRLRSWRLGPGLCM